MIIEVHVNKTVDVDVSIAEIIEQIEADYGPSNAEDLRAWLSFVSRHAAVFTRLPDTMIVQMTSSARNIIADALEKEALRFRPAGPEKCCEEIIRWKHWSVKYPDAGKAVLIQHADKYVYIGSYEVDCEGQAYWHIDQAKFAEDREVVAWADLPAGVIQVGKSGGAL